MKIRVLFLFIGSVLAQQYWPGQQYGPNYYNPWMRGPVNNPQQGGYGRRPYEGTVWRSGWIPAKYLNNAGQGSNVNYPAYSSDKVFKDHEARSYVERYYPNIFNYENQNQNPYQNQYQQRPPQDYYPNYYNQQPPPYAGGEPQQQQPYALPPPAYEDPSTFPEVVAACAQRDCYLSCRLGLMGGGRCTKAGCVCYMAFFDYDGSPTSYFYPEDNIWFELNEAERDEIRLAMKEHRVHLMTTQRPQFYPIQPKPTGRPPYVPHTRPPFRPPTRPTIRPPYNPPAPTKRTTTTRKPKPGKGDKDFFGGDEDDDDDDDDDADADADADLWG